MPVLARGSTSAGAAGLRAGRADAIGHSRKNAVMRAARPATEGPPMPHAGSPNAAIPARRAHGGTARKSSTTSPQPSPRPARPEERRGGKDSVHTIKTRWAPDPENKKKN